MRRFRFFVVSLAVLAPVAVVACKDKPNETSLPAPAPSGSASAAPLASVSSGLAAATDAGIDRKRRGMRGGRAGILFDAANALELKPEQKTKVEAAEKLLEADPGSRDALRDAAKELQDEMVVGVKAGKLDTAKLEPKYQGVEKIVKAQQDKEAQALAALHGALEPAQRKTIVEAVRQLQAARDERKGKTPDPLADAGKPGTQAKRHVERMTKDLELDAEQQKKIAALPLKDLTPFDPEEQKKQTEALLTAFEKDAFDATKLEPMDAKKLRGPVAEEAKLLGDILPILKPEQREKLAGNMSRGLGHGPGGPGGMRLPRPRPGHGSPDDVH
jgi:Spy/CpxP family protein refolding chaperone